MMFMVRIRNPAMSVKAMNNVTLMKYKSLLEKTYNFAKFLNRCQGNGAKMNDTHKSFTLDKE